MELDRLGLCGLMLLGNPLGAVEDPAAPQPPSGLMVELLRHPQQPQIDRAEPRFGWLVNGGRPGTRQSPWRVVDSSDEERTVWGWGKAEDSRSVTVPYGGSPLAPPSLV